jgi:hypothetical protein
MTSIRIKLETRHKAWDDASGKPFYWQQRLVATFVSETEECDAFAASYMLAKFNSMIGGDYVRVSVWTHRGLTARFVGIMTEKVAKALERFADNHADDWAYALPYGFRREF